MRPHPSPTVCHIYAGHPAGPGAVLQVDAPPVCGCVPGVVRPLHARPRQPPAQGMQSVVCRVPRLSRPTPNQAPATPAPPPQTGMWPLIRCPCCSSAQSCRCALVACLPEPLPEPLSEPLPEPLPARLPSILLAYGSWAMAAGAMRDGMPLLLLPRALPCRTCNSSTLQRPPTYLTPHAPSPASLQMLTLARPHRIQEPDGQSEDAAAAMAEALLAHPSLRVRGLRCWSVLPGAADRAPRCPAHRLSCRRCRSERGAADITPCAPAPACLRSK